METKNTGIIQRQQTTKSAVKAKREAGLPVTLKDYVQDSLPEVAKALPSVITPERFTRMVTSTLTRNPQLQQTTPQSFMAAMFTAAQLGVEPNTPLGQAYLIPFRNKGTLECSFILGYKGLIDLAYRSGEIANIQAHEVCENDEFDYAYGTNSYLNHKPARTNRGKVICYYGLFTTKDGASGFEVMSIEDAKAHGKKYSKSFNAGPWQTNFDEMAKKGLALDTPIPTPYGWKTMSELEKGDIVFDMNGEATEVIAVSEVKHLPCFKIKFSDGGEIVCDDEHRWVAAIGSNASRDVKEKGWRTFTINELYEAKCDGKSITVPVTPLIEYAPLESELPVDAWLVGYWLGNGGKGHGNVHCDIDDVDYVVSRIKATPFEVGAIRNDKRSRGVSIGIRGEFAKKLGEIGVLDNKGIPDQYAFASVEDRKLLLQGLMDSDGCIDRERGRAKFGTTNKAMALRFAEIARSLGEQVHICATKAKGFGKVVDFYSVEWLPAKFAPVAMPRKAALLKERQNASYRSVKDIQPVDSVATKCIAVASESKTYLAGSNMVPTHNTVLKKALKYAPLKSDFVRQINADETVRTVVSTDIFDTPADTIIDSNGEVLNYDEQSGTYVPFADEPDTTLEATE